VPRTRTDTTREEKVEELLEVADGLFRQAGYDATTTAAVAKAAQMSERTLYWYFPSKDYLLAAVVRRGAETIGEQLRDAGWPSGEPAGDLYAVLRAMRSIRHVIPAFHQRAEVSETVAVTRAEIRSSTDRAIGTMLRALGVAEDGLPASTDIVECFTDGVLLRNLSDHDLERACRTLIAGLVRHDERTQR
jgi:AcrR family transcriptional regulator